MRRALILLALALTSVPAHAEPSTAEARTVLLLTRALGYDRQLRKRAGDRVVIGVLEDPAHADQASKAREIREYLASRDGLTVRGLPVDCLSVPVQGGRPLAETLDRLDIDVLLLVHPPADWDLDAIFDVSRSTQTLTMSTDPDLVRSGAAVGAAPDGTRIRLYVNLGASRLEGASFSTELLQLAQVIR